MPRYTFLLPAYKGHFLDEMLHSIQNQTYTDFKVIISDDCSPEDLYSICKPYLSDSRFCYRRNEENMGSKSLVAHWNLLVDMCDTDYLIMASDDDIYEADFLKEIDNLINKYPDVYLYRARTQRIDEKGHALINDIFFEEKVDQLHFIQQLFLPTHTTCIANYCFHTEKLKKENGFIDFPLAWASDEATAMIMSEKGCCYTSKILFGYRRSNINITGKHSDASVSKLKVTALLNFMRWLDYFFKTRIDILYIQEPSLPFAIISRIKEQKKGLIEESLINCNWNDFNILAKRYKKEHSESYYVMVYYWFRANNRLFKNAINYL